MKVHLPWAAALSLLVAAMPGRAVDLAALDTRVVASGLVEPLFAAAPLANGRFFVNHIEPVTRDTVIASYRTQADGRSADLASRQEVLRIDINGDDFADPNLNDAIPEDNPFAGQAGARGEIVAYGLRKPFRNGFDSATGDLWIADVGQGQREALNFVAAASPGGQNFGWHLRVCRLHHRPGVVHRRRRQRMVTGGCH